MPISIRNAWLLLSLNAASSSRSNIFDPEVILCIFPLSYTQNVSQIDKNIFLVCSDEGLTLETSALQQTSPGKIKPYQPLLIKAHWHWQKMYINHLL